MNRNSEISGRGKARRHWRGIALAVTSAVLGALFLGGVAHAVTDTVFKYTAPKTGLLSIPAAAFTPTSLAYDYLNNGDTLGPTTNNLTCFVAPVHLPQNAKMTVWAMWRKSAAGDFSAAIERVSFAQNGATLILYKPSLPDTGATFKGAAFSISESVNNNLYSYFAFVCMKNTSTSFAGMRITYTYATAGD